MIDTTLGLITKYKISLDKGSQCMVDGAKPKVIWSLKLQLAERTDYLEQIDYYNKHFPHYDCEQLAVICL
jgi:hypothetical protein